MKASQSDKVREALKLMAQLSGRELSPAAVAMLFMDLEGFTEEAVLVALERCRRELRGFPSLADIVARIDDGHPGVDEAWAMLPISESDSVVWTDQMREAFGDVRHLLERDEIAARMAFKEIYGRLLGEARFNRTPPRWTPSLGHNPAGRTRVVKEAVARGRLSEAQARLLLPDVPAAPPVKRPQLTGPTDPAEPELSAVDPVAMLATIRKRIQEGGG